MRNKLDLVKLSKLENLRMRIYVVGYASRGESIIVLFMDGKDVIYSMVIDCCSYQQTNKTFEILNKYDLDKQKLNMLCWSHPDLDHTQRMNDLITRYCNTFTKILSPYGIVNSNHIVIERNTGEELIFSLIKRLNNSRNLVHKTVCVDDGHNKPYGFKLVTDTQSYDVEVNALSPMDSFINHHINNKTKTKKNHVSIVLQIKMPGNYNFLFCSDAEDEILQIIADEPFVNPLFVKIPHHGSDSSEAIFDILETSANNTLGCVTQFKAKKLPKTNTMFKYLSVMSRVDYTSQKKTKHNYGVVEYVADLYDQKSIYIHHDGQAGIYV